MTDPLTVSLLFLLCMETFSEPGADDPSEFGGHRLSEPTASTQPPAPITSDPLLLLASQLQQQSIANPGGDQSETALDASTTGGGHFTHLRTTGGPAAHSLLLAPIATNANTTNAVSNLNSPPMLTGHKNEDITGNTVDLSPKDMAYYLIKQGYLLTALEFYTELCEDGHELRELREYFANHKNFENNSGRYNPQSSGTSAGAGGHLTNMHHGIQPPVIGRISKDSHIGL